jgi:dihydroxyacetone kinase-like protein
MGTVNTQTILNSLEAVNEAILASEVEIERLDREIGDGDHFFNIKRGCGALLAMREHLISMSPAHAFHAIGMKLLATIGGASGPLFASFFIAMGKSIGRYDQPNASAFAEAFTVGVDAIRARGKADIGEKTMLDVLIPVGRLLSRLINEKTSLDRICASIKEEAYRHMLATKDMVATKGRAHYLGDRAIGHIDPGAKTCQVIIWAVCDRLLAEHSQCREQ